MGIRNHSYMRDAKLGRIFRMLLEEGPLSRTQISDRTGLSPSTVWVITGELQEKGLVRECGRDGPRVGRPSVLLEVNPRCGYFISADLTSNNISLTVIDLSLNPVMTKSFDEPMQYGEELYLQLVRAFKELQKYCSGQDMSILGLGVATPGLVTREGSVIEADNLGWKYMDLQSRLVRDFSTEVLVENDVNAAASGEFRYGTYRNLDVQNMMFVSVDTGIGCGLILDRKLFSGTKGLAGEFGHIIVDQNGPLCACGRCGCLETLAAAPAMLRSYQNKVRNTDVRDIDALLKRVHAQDADAVAIVEDAAHKIGFAIGNQINFLNVDTVLLGGRVAHASDFFAQRVREIAMSVALPSFREGMCFDRSSLGVHAASIGIASLCLIKMFYAEEL